MFCKEIKLNNGLKMPQIGLGTWRITSTNTVYNTLKTAVSLGYRHIDTALVYENEKEIGDSLQRIYKETGLKREDFFITSKLWNSYHSIPEKGLQKTLNDLQTNYLDLYLIHWPVHFKQNNDGTTIRVNNMPVLGQLDIPFLTKFMEEAIRGDKIKSWGVSNFGIQNLSLVLRVCELKPVVNQIECHPYLKQTQIVDLCIKNDIRITAYSSLGSLSDEKNPKIMEDQVILKIAEKNKITPAQVILSYLLSKDYIIIPKSTNANRLKENLSSDSSLLTSLDIQEIDEISTTFRYIDPIEFGVGRFD